MLLLLIEPNNRAFADGGDTVVFKRLDEIFAERMAGPIFGHQDAAEVSMTFEVDAEEIEDFPFHPVGGMPDLFDRGDGRIVARELDLEHAAVAMLVREKMIHDLEAILVIDTGFVVEAIHRAVGVVVEEAGEIEQSGRINNGEGVGFAINNFEHLAGEAFAEALVDCERVHRVSSN